MGKSLTRAKRQFQTTRWSLILAAGDGGDAPALGELLQAYWYPLYAFLRRSGKGVHDSQDLTQGFLAYLLERNCLGKVDPQKGRFRSFLLTSLRNYMTNAYRYETAQKRGGNAQVVSIDQEFGEERFKLEPADEITPADQFELSWAMALLDRTMAALKLECEAAEKLPLFIALQPRLSGDRLCQSYAEIGQVLGMGESAVSVALHRLRKRYGELLREEILETVAEPELVDIELRHLIEIIARR